MATSQFKTTSPYLTCPTPPSTNTKNEQDGRINLALIGLGRIGKMYLKNILSNPNINLSYVIVSLRHDPEKIKSQWNLSNTTVIQSSEVDMFYNDETVTTCLIASSTPSHVQYILSSLKHGKDIFCEKPISKSEAETNQCYQEAKRLGKILFCAFNRRFDPSFSNIQSKVRAGELGHIQSIHTTSRDSPIIPKEAISSSGGIFHDFAVHDIDLVMWVLGDVPVNVFVMANAQIPEFLAENDFDNMVIMLRFKSGTLGTIDMNRFSAYGYDQRLEVVGPKGMLKAHNQSPDHLTLSNKNGSGKSPIYYSFPSRYDEAFKLELEYFVGLVLEGGTCGVTGRMVNAVTKVVNACKLSGELGRPVDLVWEQDEIPEY